VISKGDNSIQNNEAGIIGGGIYYSNYQNNLARDINANWNIYSNLVNGKINNYISKKFTVKLDFYSKASIYSGEKFPVVLKLKDHLGKDVSDPGNYFSQVTIEISLMEDVTNNDDVNDKLNSNDNNNNYHTNNYNYNRQIYIGKKLNYTLINNFANFNNS